jgi:translation initiation factor 2D
MFHKPHSTVLSKGKKSVDVPLRKSDRKALLKEARRQFACEDDDHEEQSCLISSLLESVFMQGTLSARKLNHAQLGKVLLYYRSPSTDVEKSQQDETFWPYTITTQCVWMAVDAGPSTTIHAPTVALLSVLPPGSFPTVIVPYNVSKFACRGAHLMRAGITQLPTNTTQDIAAIQVQGNPQPFAVGRITVNTSPQSIGPNCKGVGVEIWTCYGDDFYQQQLIKHTSTNGIVNPNGGACFDDGNYGNVGFLDGKIVSPIDVVEESESVEVGTESTNIEEQVPSSDITNDDTNPNDTILHRAVCEALVNIKDSELPMTSTHFYAQLVKPRFATPVDIKQTTWKKFNPYLKAQVENELIECKAHNTDPMGYIVGINRQHIDLHGIKKDAKEVSQETKHQTLVNLYVIPHHFVNLLRLNVDNVKAVNAKSPERQGTGLLTSAEAKGILDEYLKANELLVTPTKVQLDGPLTDALYKKKPNPPETLSRKDIYKLWLNKMEPAFALVEMPGNHIAKLGRGKPPQVLIEVSLRQGRKKYSTKVRGLEDYGIDPVAFLREVTKRFACSGIVETEPEGRAALKKGYVELDFQGNLAEELQALLLGDEKLSSHGGAKDSEYSLPKSAIDVVLKKNVPTKKPRK